MSWLFSRALVEEYLGDTCSDGEPSAPLSGSLTQQAYLPPDRMTKFSRLSRFGMTFKPLTADLGEELLTSYLAAFPAKTSQQPEKEQESTELGQECGATWRELLARYDHATSMWKTPPSLLSEESTEFSGTWPRWGSMQDGVSYQQQTLVPYTKETGSGSWPTPTVCGNYNKKGLSKKSGDGLATAVAKWPTPTCQDANKATKKWREDRQNNLTAAVFNPEKSFPTPTARDYKGGYQTESLIRKDGKSRAFDALPNAVLDGKGVETSGGQLNPTWVEWLMGWPLGWTDLKPLEMDKYRSWQQQHGVCSSEFPDQNISAPKSGAGITNFPIGMESR